MAPNNPLFWGIFYPDFVNIFGPTIFNVYKTLKPDFRIKEGLIKESSDEKSLFLYKGKANPKGKMTRAKRNVRKSEKTT